MANWTTGNWIALAALVVAAIGAYLRWRSTKKSKMDTTNIAAGSRGVKQKGGAGTTHNEATDSTDVNQSG